MYPNLRVTLGLALALALATQALAGGFWLTLGQGSASTDPLAKDAVLIVRPEGCNNPAKAVVSGKAIGLVDGKRRHVPLKLVALSTPGTYAVKRDWGQEGSWVLNLVALADGRTTSAVVPIGPNGFERRAAKFFPRLPSDADIDAALK